MFRTATALAVGLSLTAAAGAQAQTYPSLDMDGVVSRTVHFADLDVGTPAGGRELAVRIRLAANAVCGGDNALMRADHDFGACVHQAIDRAANKLEIASLNQALGRSAGPNLASR